MFRIGGSLSPAMTAGEERMETPEDVAVMLRLAELGWGSKRIAAELHLRKPAASRLRPEPSRHDDHPAEHPISGPPDHRPARGRGGPRRNFSPTCPRSVGSTSISPATMS